MTDTDWRDVVRAYESIRNSNVKKIEGDMWQVYKVGNIIRVDIKE